MKINAPLKRRITESAGRYLAAARVRVGIPQRQLAWMIGGSSRGALAHIEQGRNAPTIAVFCALCEHLSLDPVIALAHILADAEKVRIEALNRGEKAPAGCVHCGGIKQHDPRCAFVLLKASRAVQRRALKRTGS